MENTNNRLSPILSFRRTRTAGQLRLLQARAGSLPFVSIIWRLRAHVMEICLIVGFYLAYLLTRGLIFSDQGGIGLVNAGRIISLEKSLGFFWEPGWQSWVLAKAPELAVFFNWTYIFTYWPIIAVVGFVLYLVRRPLYYYFRSVMAINLVFALLVFMFFPVTSPFNLSQYFANTIQELGPSFYGGSEMGSLYNVHAAMPSLHFSWTVILGVLFLRKFKGWTKLVGVLYPVITLFAITITGNHFILDAVIGGALALASFVVMELGFRRAAFWRRVRLEAFWREFRGRPRLATLWSDFCASYRRAWFPAQERLRSELRRNWLSYRVAWLRLRARLPVGFRRRTMWGGGRIT